MRHGQKRINNTSYLDEKITAVNREINQEFYEENNSTSNKDSNLYNMGDSTPILNEENPK